MTPKQIQDLGSLGCDVITGCCVVIEHDDKTLGGVDSDENPIVNRGKGGTIKEVFCVLPKGKKIKVYHGNSSAEVEQKMAAKTPDIIKEKYNVEISVGPAGR